MKELILSFKESIIFKEFMKNIEEKAQEWEVLLKNSTEISEIYRAQGALNFFDFVRNLPDIMIMEEEDDKKTDETDYSDFIWTRFNKKLGLFQ